jgi:hypothetical protein
MHGALQFLLMSLADSDYYRSVEAFSCEGGAYADGAASDHRWSIDLDTFVHDLLLAVTTCSTANPTVSMTASVGQ